MSNESIDPQTVNWAAVRSGEIEAPPRIVPPERDSDGLLPKQDGVLWIWTDGKSGYYNDGDGFGSRSHVAAEYSNDGVLLHAVAEYSNDGELLRTNAPEKSHANREQAPKGGEEYVEDSTLLKPANMHAGTFQKSGDENCRCLPGCANS